MGNGRYNGFGMCRVGGMMGWVCVGWGYDGLGMCMSIYEGLGM